MKYLLLFILLVCVLFCKAQATINANEAKDHIGETVTICDRVVSTYYYEKGKGQPTFLNFGAKYPNNTFDVVIWAEDAMMFPSKPIDLSGKPVCVTGRIKLYKGKPEMIVKYSSQIKVQ
jgi:DNA/RNA endonuclease YhcR with UshA esterase domain